jgi:hypothetical protein
MKKIFLTLALAIGLTATAQVKVGDNVTTLNSNSLLELESTTKGLLFPRVALTGTTAFAPLAAHVAGMTVYNTATAGDVTPGLYTNSGSAWVKLGGSTSTATSVVTNTATSYTVLGTEDIILSNCTSASLFTLPASATVGKRITIANNVGSGGNISIAVASGGVFWNGSGYATSPNNTNVFTFTGVNGWICEAIGLN